MTGPVSFKNEETRRSEAHASRLASTGSRSSSTVQHIFCPHMAALWRDGYTAHQIASIMGRSIADVRIVTAQLCPPERVEFNSGNLRRTAP